MAEKRVSPGELLERWRIGKGLSQKDAGALVDVTQAAWSEWESEKTTPSAGMLFKIESVTGVGVDAWREFAEQREAARVKQQDEKRRRRSRQRAVGGQR